MRHIFLTTAQERLNELEGKMENMLATVDKVFKVELMKMPPSLQKTFIADLISGESSLWNNWSSPLQKILKFVIH